jgi:hypothetical protein
MRHWLALIVLVPAGAAAQAAPGGGAQLALAGQFDLGDTIAGAALTEAPKPDGDDRWLPADLAPPPGPPHDPPLFRWRGKKVKMRLSF